MRRLVFALLLLVSGCGREAIDLDRTITLRIAGLAGIAPWADTVATGTMVAAVAALGGHTGEGAEQVVFVWPGAAEACVARGESVGFAVPEHYSLFVCPPAGREPAWLRSVLRHELGHLLGASHLPCATGAVMAPQVECIASDGYTTADLRAICYSGLAVGGICNSRASLSP